LRHRHRRCTPICPFLVPNGSGSRTLYLAYSKDFPRGAYCRSALQLVPYLGIEPSSSRFSSLAISVSPQTCTLQISLIATQLNLDVVSTSGCLQQSHMVISQCVCITS